MRETLLVKEFLYMKKTIFYLMGNNKTNNLNIE